MSKSGVPRWLEAELSRHLGPVQAPDGLWDRIQQPTTAVRVRAVAWARWPIAAILTLAAVAGTYWLPGGAQDPGLHRITLAVLNSDRPERYPADWDLRCALPANASTYRLAEFSARIIPMDALAVAGRPHSSVGCHQCHDTVLN